MYCYLLVPRRGWWRPRLGSACSETGSRRSASSPCCHGPRAYTGSSTVVQVARGYIGFISHRRLPVRLFSIFFSLLVFFHPFFTLQQFGRTKTDVESIFCKILVNFPFASPPENWKLSHFLVNKAEISLIRGQTEICVHILHTEVYINSYFSTGMTSKVICINSLK